MRSMRNKVQVRKCEEDVTGGKNQWVRECKREMGLDKKKKREWTSRGQIVKRRALLEKIGGGIREERKSAKEVNECGGSASDARFPVV